MSNKRAFLSVLIIGTILAGFCGCERVDEMSTPIVTSSEPYSVPSTPDILMENFAEAYGSRDLVGYEQLLHPDFIFSFQACDVEKLGLSSDHYTRDEELATAGRMFSGEPVKKDDGAVLPAITGIEFLTWEREGEWAPAHDVSGQDVLRATYQCKVRIDRTGASALYIQGPSVFYAIDRNQAGGAAPLYELIGWIDQTDGCGP